MTQKTKICTKCERELPATLEYFYYYNSEYKGKKYGDGLRYQCKDCWKEYKQKHRKQVAKNRKEYKKKNWEKYLSLNNLHNKIRRLKSNQKYCSICNQPKKLELSSINGIYSENPNDYWWLCHECHHLYDRINKIHIKNYKTEVKEEDD